MALCAYLEDRIRVAASDDHGLLAKAVLVGCLRRAAVGGQTIDGVISKTLAVVRRSALLPC